MRRGLSWIAFDVVGTLIRPEPPVAEIYCDVGRRYGSQMSIEEVRNRFSHAFRNRTQGDSGFQTNEADERCFWRQIVADVFEDVSDHEHCFVELFDHFARPNAWRVFADVAETLSVLRTCGFRLAVASNFDGRLNQVLDGSPALAEIKTRAISSQIGARKPSAEFYAGLVELCQSAPAEILMIGDDEINDVHSARQCGLQAIRIKRNARAGRGELSQLTDLIELIAKA